MSGEVAPAAAGENRYTRYFYHCFPQWVGSPDPAAEPPQDAALRVLSLMFKWGLLLTPEEIVFQGESFTDEPRARPVHITQRRLCLTELAEDEMPEHAQVFGPLALEFDQPTIRRIGGMPVVYIPQALSDEPGSADFALVGQTFVYRLFDIYQLLSDLAEIDEHIKGLGPEHASVTLGHPQRDGRCEYPLDLLRHFFENLTYMRQPLAQLSSALRVLGCFFYPTDAALKCRAGDEHGQLAYYREREWRVVSDLYFKGEPLDEKLPPEAAAEIAAAFYGSFSPYEGVRTDGVEFTRACKIIRSFDGRPVMQAVRRILAPREIKAEVEAIALRHGYTGVVAAYTRTQ